MDFTVGYCTEKAIYHYEYYVHYSPLAAQTNEQRESGKINYFTKRTAILFLLARTFQQPDTLNQR